MPPNTALRRVLGVVTVPAVLGLLLLPALLPLLQAGLLPCTHDNMFHAYRIVAMRSMLDHGWVFSRWVPNLALGYGYPFFNYREPLPYWVGEAGYLAGLPLSLVLGLIYAASLVGAAWGAYVLARDLFGEHAGWIAGVAYGLGPYVLLDPLRRGNLPESVALALLPWLFVAIRRVVLGRRRGAAFATLVLLVALFLTHNISSLLAAPFLGLYVVLLAFLYRDRKGWMMAFLVVGAAILLTAWFWLPALAERGMVQLDLSRATRNNDFHYNFVTWQEMLLTPPVAHDPNYLNPPMRVSVGIGQLVFGRHRGGRRAARRGEPPATVDHAVDGRGSGGISVDGDTGVCGGLGACGFALVRAVPLAARRSGAASAQPARRASGLAMVGRADRAGARS